MSVAENIAFGRPGATQAEIEQAARDAQAHDFILGFKDGYQTVIGERGVTLSGGQKQRTAIARSLIRNPRILVLDDALSSVDTYTEEEILKRLRVVMKGRTSIIISHRISTVKDCDLIIVLDDGGIADAPVGQLFYGDPGIERGVIPTRWNHISPRVGMVWDPFGDGRTSIRAAAGLVAHLRARHRVAVRRRPGS